MSNKAKTAAMKIDGKPTLTPKLRFPTFIGQTVRQVKLKDVTAESTTRNGETLPTTAVMGVSKTEGIVPMEERIISSDIARYKLVQKNWFAYNPMRLNIGSIARWQGEGDILVSPDYVVFKCLNEADSGLDAAFLDHFRRSGAWENFVKHGGDGSVRVRIYYQDIGRLAFTLPTMAEQQKIADCLTSVDELIAAQAREVDALKTHKNGLMQQLFPREGETQPRRRFPEFQAAGEWKQNMLKGIAEITSGSTPLRSNAEFFEGGSILWVKTTDLNNSFITETEEKITSKARARLNPAGSILVAMYGGFNQIGRTGCLSLPAATNQAISVLVVDRKIALPVYVLAWLNAKVEYWKKIAGSSRKDPNITGSDVGKFPICFPGIEEQLRIADCLTNLDDLIAAKTRKLEAHKTHKKGLMQQLFPSAEEVET